MCTLILVFCRAVPCSRNFMEVKLNPNVEIPPHFAAVGGREQKVLATLSHNGNGVGTCMGLRYSAAQLRPYSEALC